MKSILFLFSIFCFSILVSALNASTEIPLFLLNAPAHIIEEHSNLLKENADNELAPVMDQWVNKQNVYIRIRWTKYKADETEKQMAADKFRKELCEKLSERAKEVDKELYLIGQDQKMTKTEKKEKMRQVLAAEDPEIRAEIEEAIQTFNQMRQPEHERFKREWGMRSISDFPEMGMYQYCSSSCCGCSCGCCCCKKK